MEAHDARSDPRGNLVLIGLGLLTFVIGIVYGSHKYQMWRSRRKRDNDKERRDD